MKGHTRILVAVGIGAAGIFLLVYASIQASARQFVRVHELASSAETYDGKRIKLSGEIVEDSVSFQQESLKLRFRVKDVEGEKGDDVSDGKEPETNIIYQGAKPDAFKEGGVAIVKGTFNKEKNLVEASTLQAKCPSRYKKDSKKENKEEGNSEDSSSSVKE